jgi:hypothetical protein
VIFVVIKTSLKLADPVSAGLAYLVPAQSLALRGIRDYQDATLKTPRNESLDFIAFC